MKIRSLSAQLLAAALAVASPLASAWGPLGHAVIGQAGVAAADPAAQRAVAEILGTSTPVELQQALDTACNWPDAYRETHEGAWSEPLHYVNMPRGEARYDRERDCPDGLCVTEGIRKYAAELALPAGALESRRRWEAFAWLCHLVGDLHQPLHAGYRDDRGGNTLTVRFRGETDDLHEFWDAMLSQAYYRQDFPAEGPPLSAAGGIPAFNPGDVAAWTEESHELAATAAYPPRFVDGMEIDEAFAVRSWALAARQWRKAAGRLAAILDVVLGPAPDTRGPD